jgi:hypothetical protein
MWHANQSEEYKALPLARVPNRNGPGLAKGVGIALGAGAMSPLLCTWGGLGTGQGIYIGKLLAQDENDIRSVRNQLKKAQSLTNETHKHTHIPYGYVEMAYFCQCFSPAISPRQNFDKGLRKSKIH